MKLRLNGSVEDQNDDGGTNLMPLSMIDLHSYKTEKCGRDKERPLPCNITFYLAAKVLYYIANFDSNAPNMVGWLFTV